MKIYNNIEQLREAIKNAERPIGLVPTMGFLHQGHLALINQAKKYNKTVIVTIFVNPTQFGPNEDYEKYPRDIDHDINLLKSLETNFVFIPERESLYTENHNTWVNVEKLDEKLEGHFRPNHFKGVATIVLKLLNITTPDNAYFGQKDAQQVQIIKQMVADLNLSIKINSIPTVREYDGLALSSRNVYLTKDERKSAKEIYQSLLLAQTLFEKGINNAEIIKKNVSDHIIKNIKNSKIDYVSITQESSLEDLQTIKDSALLSIAIHVGKTRLIDNLILSKK
ncbi:MAG: pantoate--beta-alanine ligase [Chloroflexi bacterium]|nr:pantoate--beta-alanine ligase [Chloroflexota bacterium]